MQELRRIFHRRRAAEAEAADSSPATDRGRRPGARAEHRAWRQRSVPRVRPEHARHRDRASGSVQKMTDVADRRKHARIALKGTAILLAGEYAVRSRLANMSNGGFLARTLVTPPLRLLGRSVDIELRLDDPLAQWNRLAGKILRIGNDSLAICLESTPALVRLVDEMTDASRTRERVISVILIDEDERRRKVLGEAFRTVGCSLIEAATSLEAIVRLGESSFEPDVIAVADSIPAVTANEMREFVGRNHPRVKLVSITDVIAPDINIFQLTPEDLRGNLADAIRRVLGRPRTQSQGCAAGTVTAPRARAARRAPTAAAQRDRSRDSARRSRPAPARGSPRAAREARDRAIARA